MQQTRPEHHWSMSAFVAPLSLLDLLLCRALRMLQLTGVLITNNQSEFDSNAYDPSIGMRIIQAVLGFFCSAGSSQLAVIHPFL